MTLARLFGRSPRRPDRWVDDPADAALVESLAAYADEMVPADDPALARSRETLRAAFLQARQPATRVEAGRRSSGHFAPRRIGFAATLVALMVFSSVAGVLAESGAGQPFYRLRLDLEALTLPAAGTPERLAADLDRAQAQFDEAARAAAGSDWAAEAAAADAYADVIASIAGEPGANGDPVRTKLTAQLQALERLRASGRGPADAALDGAIGRVRACLADLPSPDATPRPGDGNGNGGTSAEPSATGGSDGPHSSARPQTSVGPPGSNGPQSSAGPRTSAGPNGSTSPSGTGSGGPGGGGTGGNDGAASSPSPTGQGSGPNGGNPQGPSSSMEPAANGPGAAAYSGTGSGSGESAPNGGT